MRSTVSLGLVLSTLVLTLAACGGSSTTAEPTTPASTTPVATADPTEQPAAERFGRVTIEQLEAKLAAGTVHVFDNNNRETYEEGHIPGATWVHYDQITAETFPSDHAAELVFYCANEQCHACHHAAERALELGYTNVHILPAGIQGWRAAGKPTVAGASST